MDDLKNERDLDYDRNEQCEKCSTCKNRQENYDRCWFLLTVCLPDSKKYSLYESED